MMSLVVYILNWKWLPDREEAIGKCVQARCEDKGCLGDLRVVSRQVRRAVVVQAGWAVDRGGPEMASCGRQGGGAREGKSAWVSLTKEGRGTQGRRADPFQQGVAHGV